VIEPKALRKRIAAVIAAMAGLCEAPTNDTPCL
jgi:hypothetical protein